MKVLHFFVEGYYDEKFLKKIIQPIVEDKYYLKYFLISGKKLTKITSYLNSLSSLKLQDLAELIILIREYIRNFVDFGILMESTKT